MQMEQDIGMELTAAFRGQTESEARIARRRMLAKARGWCLLRVWFRGRRFGGSGEGLRPDAGLRANPWGGK